jgi:putative ABC transport system permease protein
MAWQHELKSAAGSLIGRRREEREMNEEMRFHIDMETKRLIATGLDPKEAHQRAIRDFGGVAWHSDNVRDERGTSFVEEAWSDVRFAARSLARRPGFTLMATLTLALGIGATTTLFSVVKRALLTPLPYGNADGIAVVWSAWKGFDQTWLSYDEWEGWKARIPAFADIGLYSDGAITLDGDQPERVRSTSAHANIFPILGVRPALGRNFSADEDRPGGPAVAILSHDLWQRRYASDPAVIGRSIQVAGNAATVIGVMPAGFRMPVDFGVDGPTDIYFPLATDAARQGAVPGPAFPQSGSSHGYYAVARLAPGATSEIANAQLASVVAELEKFGYMSNVSFRAYTVPVEQQILGRVRPMLTVVFGAVFLVLLIACANVAGLLLVRGDSRRREIAVRVALGAGTRRLARLLLAESALLGIVGGAAGVLLAMTAVGIVRANAPATLPRVAEASVDVGVLVFSLVIAALVAVLVGLPPAMQASRLAPGDDLRDGGRSATMGHQRLRWRQLLVAAEIAIAVVLVVAGGLMVRSVRNLLAIDAGIRPEGVLTMRLSTPASIYPDSIRVAGFWNELQRRVSELPGVTQVGAVRNLPLGTTMGDWGLTVEGYTPPPNRGTPGDWQVVTPGYIEAMGLRVREGRSFTAGDDMSGPLSMIVNRTFVATYIKDGRPLGRRVQINGSDSGNVYSIVGVVEDVHHNSLVATVKPEFYVTLAQFARAPGNTRRSMTLVVRTSGDPAGLINPVRSTIRSLDGRLPVSELRTMRDVVNGAIAGPRFAQQVLGTFGIVALLLSAIGIFGIVSQVVASRSHEFGIRAALGAAPKDLVRLSLGAGLKQAGTGLAVGVVAALLFTRAMTPLLQGVPAADPWTYAAVIVVTTIVALAASLVPARRAARSDPARVLGAS